MHRSLQRGAIPSLFAAPQRDFGPAKEAGTCYDCSVRDARDRSSDLKALGLYGEIEMDSKLYLTIAGIIAILYGIGFVLIPERMGEVYGVPYDPHSVLNIHSSGRRSLERG